MIRAWRGPRVRHAAPRPAVEVTLRAPASVLELAAALKRENPDRTAAQVTRVLRAAHGWSPSARTLQRHFARLEFTDPPGRDAAGGVRPVRGRPAQRVVDR